MPSQPKHRILLVDDEPQVLVALEDLLGDSFVVLKATSAHAALALAQADPEIAVIVTDQRMPKMTGDELLQSLGDDCNAQRIMVTGFADLNAVTNAVNKGKLFAYVTKPWNADDLVNKVDMAAQQFNRTKLIASERKLLHDLMHHSSDGIYFKDREQRFVETNGAFRELLNIKDAQSIRGKTLGELLGDIGLTRAVSDDERRILAGGTGALNEVREYPGMGVDPSLPARWLSEMRAPVVDPEAGVLGLIGITRDVSTQRAIEQRFADVQRMDAVGRLAGGVAHDFNNLLSIILCCGELLLAGLASDDQHRDDVVLILDAAGRASVLTSQLLSFTRQQVQQPRSLQLNDVVRALENMLKRAVGKQIEVVLELNEPLWRVWMDASQLERVILNLALNARDAMPDGGSLYISTRNVEQDSPEALSGRYVMLAVRDTGIGMPAETRRRIFEPFFTTKEVGKGCGLGLATVHGMVTQQGGLVHCDSELGSGTEFRVYLARDSASARAIPSRPPEPSLKPGASTILLVEDEENLRRLAASILRKEGYHVIEANGPSSAQRVMSDNKRPIDLLLTDVVMPGGTGPQLALDLRRQNPSLRVMYMTGYAGDTSLMDRALCEGAVLLEKPFSPIGLCSAVAGALEQSPPVPAAAR